MVTQLHDLLKLKELYATRNELNYNNKEMTKINTEKDNIEGKQKKYNIK